MLRRKSYTCVVLAALFVATASAVAEQTWVVRTWQSDEGLPDNTVMAIDQTPDGFLWVATHTGLVRFDGVQFREFSTQAPGMAVDVICAMCADRQGRIWVAKDRGSVVCVDQGRVTEIVGDVTDGSDGRARMLVVDREDAVWVSRINGELLRIKDGKVRAYTSADGLPPGGVFELAVDPGGRVWFVQGEMLGFIREEKATVLAKEPFLRICIARGGGVRLFSETTVATYTEGKGFSDHVAWRTEISAYAGPTALLEDRTGRLWAGTRAAGLFCIDGNQSVKVRASPQTILCLKEDAEGNIWVGTRGGGLKQVRPRVAELLTIGSATQRDGIQSLCKDTQGQLWAVVWLTGLVVRNTGQGWDPLPARDAWTGTLAKCVAADPAGGVWIGTASEGLFYWKDGAVARHFSSTNGLTGGAIHALYAPASGELWFSTSPGAAAPNGTLFCCKDGALRGFPLPVGAGAVNALAPDGAGGCWVATANGMLLRMHGTVLTDETPLLLSDKLHPIRSLLATPDRSLWIGFAGRGLGRLKDGRFTSFRREHGLYDDYVSQILSDGRGHLWLAGNRGISSVRIKDLEERASGLLQQIHAVVYKQKDGLLGLQASYNSWPTAFCDKDGALFFAMQSGVAILYPDAITADPLPPKVVIDRVLATGEVVALYGAIGKALPGTNAASLFELGEAGADLQLPSGRRQVEFCFTAPAFMMPESIRFKYQLQGLDKEWIESGARRSALYSQLAPGRYRFRVIACNRDGVWNEQGASLDVTVPPFWWETVWFRVGGPLLAVGLVGCWLVLGLRRRYRHKLERMELQQATEKERMRISRDLHDDLGAGLTQISLVNALIQKGAADAEKVRGASSKVNEIMSGLVRSLDEIVWAVNPRNDTFDGLVTYLGRYAEEFLKVAGLRCRLDLPLDVPAWPVAAKVRHGLFLAFKETLNNAAKHSAASVVRISVRTQVDGFELLIEDDGQGFKTEQGERAGRSGLANIRNRLAEIGGSCVIESDLGKGTCVRFRMAKRVL